jgi:hypothetical protein
MSPRGACRFSCAGAQLELQAEGLEEVVRAFSVLLPGACAGAMRMLVQNT